MDAPGGRVGVGVVREFQAGVLGVAEGFLEQGDEMGVGELIVDVCAVPAVLDEPGMTQGAEVTADSALGELEAVHECRNALLASHKTEQNLDADGFGEGFEEGGDVPEVVRVRRDVKRMVLHVRVLSFAYPDK
ncbi:hypothetical protein GCM10008956_39730 [Deinococcus arenae]|uniref:Uncharacterized protein n=1 Tax=Deinococcus arenae TaxID=1452751 RepID=A0A8H9GUP6_9DEIO|nr:hypothetical protein GCM10008956_39730 [Deinococcus arenae]